MAIQYYSDRELIDLLEAAGLNPASDRLRDTLKLACEGHKGQFRDTRSKDVQVPFIVHPVGTALLTIEHYSLVERELDGADLETIVCVALTHDLLEDTGTDPTLLEKVAGARVRSLVEALTKPPAGVAGRGKDARNREFTQQILSGGPGAVFVKMCDSMHNMSRPNMTPAKLFRKTVDKARKLYLPLLSHCSLGRQFEQVFLDAINKAERDAIEEERFARDTPAPQSLDEAVHECVVASTVRCWNCTT